MKSKDHEALCAFQDKVSELLLRHRSILDSLSKHAESTARVNRAITKTVTGCGCISVHARKQNLPPDFSLDDYKKHMDSHLEGNLCENCKEVIEEELGNHLFYLAALCHLLDYKLHDLFEREHNRLKTLGYFRLS